MRCEAIAHVHHDGIHHAPGDELELDEATATLLDAKGLVVVLEPFSGAPVINGRGGGDTKDGHATDPKPEDQAPASPGAIASDDTNGGTSATTAPEPSQAAAKPKATPAKGGAQAKGGSGKGKAAK